MVLVKHFEAKTRCFIAIYDSTAYSLRCLYLKIWRFLLMMMTTTTKPIALPLAHAHGIITGQGLAELPVERFKCRSFIIRLCDFISVICFIHAILDPCRSWCEETKVAPGDKITEQTSGHYGRDIQKVKGAGVSMEDHHSLFHQMQVLYNVHVASSPWRISLSFSHFFTYANFICKNQRRGNKSLIQNPAHPWPPGHGIQLGTGSHTLHGALYHSHAAFWTVLTSLTDNKGYLGEP